MRYASLLFGLTLATCGAGLRVGELGERTAKEQSWSAVMIAVRCDGGTPGAMTGTGVMLSSTRVLTAYHVVHCTSEKIAELWAFESDGMGHPMRIEAIDATNDLARLAIADDAEFFSTIDLRFAQAKEGKRVCMASRVPSRYRRCGVVDEVDDEANGIYFSVPVEPGNSGSGLYDEYGRLVGIVTQMITLSNGQSASGIATAIPGGMR